MKSPKCPGLHRRQNGDGSTATYWRASKAAIQAGWIPKLVRIVSEDADEIASRCVAYQTQMLMWMSEQQRGFDMPKHTTIASLFAAYLNRPESPYHRIKWNSQRSYRQALDQIEKAWGSTLLRDANLAVLQRWYSDARWPEGREDGKPDLARKAHGFMSMLRRVIGFGVAAEIPGCDRLDRILSKVEFQAPARRQSAIELSHIEAFLDAAMLACRPLVALGTALQFECAMRQRDVIGEWQPLGPGERPKSRFVMNGRQWVNGLTWNNVRVLARNDGAPDDWILTKVTTKTGSEVSWDLRLCPMAFAILERVPPEMRIGPLVCDETSRPLRPFAEHAYHRHWRTIAAAAELPPGIWNMDARAGAATEAQEAGVTTSDLRPTMGHSDERTTVRYVRGSALPQARRVAEARLAHRKKSVGTDRETKA